MRIPAAFLFCLVLLLALHASFAQAQDRTPLRERLVDPPGWIRAEAGLEGSVQEVREMWSWAASGVAEGVGQENPRPVEVVLLSDATFRPWARGLIADWGIAFASWPAGPVVLNADAIAGGQKELREVLRHELSHVYLGQLLPSAGVPRWFVEGVAQAQSGEWRFLDTVQLIGAATMGQLPPLSEIGMRFPAAGRPADLAYKVSLQAVLDLDERLEDRGGWRALITQTRRLGRFDEAFLDLLGMPLNAYYREFHEQIRGDYGWFAVFANPMNVYMAMTVLFLLGLIRIYIRNRQRLAAMEDEPE